LHPDKTNPAALAEHTRLIRDAAVIAANDRTDQTKIGNKHRALAGGGAAGKLKPERYNARYCAGPRHSAETPPAHRLGTCCRPG